ncbi:hypothetical protein AMTRI_Chr03g49030 [Amborella trichopoda]
MMTVATLVLFAVRVALGEAHKHLSQHHGLDVTFYEHTPSCELVEKASPANSYTLHGLEAQLEAAYPGIISCANTIALAALDASILAGIPHYSVPCGRRDSRSSRAIDKPQCRRLVVLSGAHSIGNAHCSSFGYVLYDHSHAYSMDKSYADELRPIFPTITLPEFTNAVVKLSKDLAHKMDALTRSIVRKMTLHSDWWARKFCLAMEKMGTIEVLTDGQGEVRSSS